MPENTPVVDEPQTASAGSTEPQKTCKCGYTREHPRVRPVYSYGMLGIFIFMFGITAVPKRVDYQCANCGVNLETVTDPAELKAFRYRAKR